MVVERTAKIEVPCQCGKVNQLHVTAQSDFATFIRLARLEVDRAEVARPEPAPTLLPIQRGRLPYADS